MCGWILLSILLLLALLVQTIRIIDMKGDVFRKKSLIELNERDEKHLADRLNNMTVSRDSYADLYTDACEAIKDGNSKLSRLEDDVQKGNALALKLNREIIDLKQQNRKLISWQKPNSIAYLKSGMCDIARFIAANQWMMEESKSLAEAVASVSEVAASITEREN